MEEQTSTDTNSETMERYFDSLLASHTALSEALEGARKRGVSASEKLSEALFERQREALELTKKLAMSPQAVSDNTKAVLQAATEAQSRALDFAKELYSSQTEMGDEFPRLLQGRGEQLQGSDQGGRRARARLGRRKPDERGPEEGLRDTAGRVGTKDGRRYGGALLPCATDLRRRMRALTPSPSTPPSSTSRRPSGERGRGPSTGCAFA